MENVTTWLMGHTKDYHIFFGILGKLGDPTLEVEVRIKKGLQVPKHIQVDFRLIACPYGKKKKDGICVEEYPGVPDLICDLCGQPESEHDDGACPEGRKIYEP